MARLIELMLRASPNARGYARLRAGTVALGIVIILAFAVSSAYDIWRAQRHAVLSADREVENLVSVLAAQTAWSWRGPEAALSAMARLHTDGLPAEQIDRRLAELASVVPQVSALRIVDAHGLMNHTSEESARRDVNVADRSYFKAQQSATAPDLFVSEPLVTRSDGRPAVVLSRRLEEADGRFAGVASAVVDLGYLNSLYSGMKLRGNITVDLLREDGTLLLRYPAAPSLVGHSYPALLALVPGAALHIVSPIDGAREITAVAPIGSTRLAVAVARNEATALTPAYRESMHNAVRTLFLVLLGALTIGAMLRQLHRLEQAGLALQQSQKMEAIGTLAGGIAHDFNNILGAILGYGELAQQQAPEGSSLRRYVDNIMRAGTRARALVDRILGFSRSGLAEQVPVDIQSVVTETLDLLQASLSRGVRLETALWAADAAVLGDESRLHQVILNLCTNALQAMPEGGVLRVALERTGLLEARTLSHGQLGPGAYVRLMVSDTGTGIREEVMDRIFDPFFTTKPVGGGTGLGLSLVHGIVMDLGGAIDVSSVVGKGTTFCIWLPVTSASARSAAEETRDLPRGHGETVMIVDDEPALVSLSEEMLADLGYEPVGFGSSAAALLAFRKNPQRFDAVLTDELMPDLLGTQLAHEIKALRPRVPILLMSGHGGVHLAERAGAARVSELLPKPLPKRDLAEALARVLAAAHVRVPAD